MSTLAEIEAAAATLSPEEQKHLESFLRELREQAEEARLHELYRRTGVHPFPRRNGAVITNEMINQIREEERRFVTFDQRIRLGTVKGCRPEHLITL